MAIADASGTRLAYVVESTEGTTPSSPTFQIVRMTSENFAYRKETVTSEEIRSDRNVSDAVEVGRRAEGGFNLEMSYGTFDTLLEGLLMSTWSSDVIKNASTRKSFTFEKTFELGATDSFNRYTGCLISGMNLEVAAREIVTGGFTVLGRGGSVGTSALSGATYTAATTTAVLNAASHVGSLTISGVSPAAKVRRISLSITNNLREQPQIGSVDLAGVGLGRFEITANVEAYYENTALYQAILDHDDIVLTFTIGAASGSQYTIELGRLKPMNGDPTAPGNNQDVMLPVEFMGTLDPSGSPANDCTIKITRAVA